MVPAQIIREFLKDPALAIVGVSRSPHHFGNGAYRALTKKGYRVYAIHPSGGVIDGVQTYRRFEDLPEKVKALLVVVPEQQGMSVVREAAAAGIRYVWLQQGAESPALLKLCESLRLETVFDECVLMFADPAGIHRAHRWIRRVTRGLPAA